VAFLPISVVAINTNAFFVACAIFHEGSILRESIKVVWVPRDAGWQRCLDVQLNFGGN